MKFLVFSIRPRQVTYWNLISIFCINRYRSDLLPNTEKAIAWLP